ncbi:Atu4866 domain-containing protein [Plantactinospora solaniradicis]|uniref:Atu4866 domain-containing protein n=1 Tax=Plantactinospora solaniradicis TaxID=1723736 RepID=A0ABW1K488_9ACTN
MRGRLGVVLSGACAAVLLAACSVGPDSGRPAVPDDAAQPHLQDPAPPANGTPPTPTPGTAQTEAAGASPHPYLGMWVTSDGHIRQELLPNGRYDEARGDRQSAYTGSYRIIGDRIDYIDDTGFTADGTFDGDILHHGGYVFYREGSGAHRRAEEGRR